MVLFVGDGSLADTGDGLQRAIMEGAAGAQVRLGFSTYEPDQVATLDELLDAAYRAAHPVLAS